MALLCFHLFSYHIEPSSSFTVIVTADAAHEQRTALDRSVERGDMSGPYVRVRVRALGCPVLLLVKGERGERKWAPFRFSSVHYILLPSPFFPYLAFTCFVSSFFSLWLLSLSLFPISSFVYALIFSFSLQQKKNPLLSPRAFLFRWSSLLQIELDRELQLTKNKQMKERIVLFRAVAAKRVEAVRLRLWSCSRTPGMSLAFLVSSRFVLLVSAPHLHLLTPDFAVTVLPHSLFAWQPQSAIASVSKERRERK